MLPLDIIPLQYTEHLDRAFTDAYRMGADQVTRGIVEETISAGLDDLDARLPKNRRFLKGKLDAERTDELSTLLHKAGLPI